MADQPNNVFGNEPVPNGEVTNQAPNTLDNLLKNIKNENGEQK